MWYCACFLQHFLPQMEPFLCLWNVRNSLADHSKRAQCGHEKNFEFRCKECYGVFLREPVGLKLRLSRRHCVRVKGTPFVFLKNLVFWLAVPFCANVHVLQFEKLCSKIAYIAATAEHRKWKQLRVFFSCIFEQSCEFRLSKILLFTLFIFFSSWLEIKLSNHKTAAKPFGPHHLVPDISFAWVRSFSIVCLLSLW